MYGLYCVVRTAVANAQPYDEKGRQRKKQYGGGGDTEQAELFGA